MKENKKKILKALTEKHIESIKIAKLSSIEGGGLDNSEVVIPTD